MSGVAWFSPSLPDIVALEAAWTEASPPNQIAAVRSVVLQNQLLNWFFHDPAIHCYWVDELTAAGVHATDYHTFPCLASVSAAKAEDAEAQVQPVQTKGTVRFSPKSAQKKRKNKAQHPARHRRPSATNLEPAHKILQRFTRSDLTTPARQTVTQDPQTATQASPESIASTSRVPARPPLPKDSSIAINLEDDDDDQHRGGKSSPLLPPSPSIGRSSPNPLIARVAQEQQQPPASRKKPFKMPPGATPFVPMAKTSKEPDTADRGAGDTRKAQSRSPSVVLMTPKRGHQRNLAAEGAVTESARKRRTRSFVPPPPPVTSLVGQSIMANPLGSPFKQTNKQEKDESQELSLSDYEGWLSRLKKEGE